MTGSKKLLDLEQRKKHFAIRTNLLIFIIILFSLIMCGLINFFIYNSLFFGLGTYIFCLIIIITLSFRNYNYIMQLSAEEFTDKAKYLSLFRYLLMINIAFILIVYLIPSNDVKLYLGRTITAAFIFIFIFLLFNIIINSLNIYAPIWFRQREILGEESDVLKREKRELEQKFRELGREKLKQFTEKGKGTEAKQEKITLEILEQRMLDIQKFLKFTLENQMILLSRQYENSNKLFITTLFFCFNFVVLIALVVKSLIIYI